MGRAYPARCRRLGSRVPADARHRVGRLADGPRRGAAALGEEEVLEHVCILRHIFLGRNFLRRHSFGRLLAVARARRRRRHPRAVAARAPRARPVADRGHRPHLAAGARARAAPGGGLPRARPRARLARRARHPAPHRSPLPAAPDGVRQHADAHLERHDQAPGPPRAGRAHHARARPRGSPRDADHPHRGRPRLIDAVTEAHLDNERNLLGALTADERRRLADLLRKLQLGLPAL